MVRTDPDSASIAERVLTDASQVPSRARQRSVLKDPQRCLAIFRYILPSAISPLGAPPCPRSPGVTNREDAWKRPYREVQDGLEHLDWQHMELIDNIRRICVKVVNTPYALPLEKLGNWFRCNKWRFRFVWRTTTGPMVCRRIRIKKYEGTVAPLFAILAVITVVIYDSAPRPGRTVKKK